MTIATIISMYPFCGQERLKQINDNRVLDLSDDKSYLFTKRKRTDEELDILKKIWEEDDHLMSPEGYINQIKDDLIEVSNDNAMFQFISDIKKYQNDYSIILIPFNEQFRSTLKNNNIPFFTVAPQKDQLDTWIGKMYLNYANKEGLLLGEKNTFLREVFKMISKWNIEVGKLIEHDTYGSKVILLKNNEEYGNDNSITFTRNEIGQLQSMINSYYHTIINLKSHGLQGTLLEYEIPNDVYTVCDKIEKLIGIDITKWLTDKEKEQE